MSLGERWLRLGWENNCSRYKNIPLILVPCGLHKFPRGPAYFLLTGSACYSCLPGSLCFFLLAIWIAFVLTCGRVCCEGSGQGVGRWGERRPLCTPKNKMLKRYWEKRRCWICDPASLMLLLLTTEVSLFLYLAGLRRWFWECQPSCQPCTSSGDTELLAECKWLWQHRASTEARVHYVWLEKLSVSRGTCFTVH